MKLTIGPIKYEKDKSGILYVLAFNLEDTPLVKIGMTQRPYVEERVCEILTAIWKRYRLFPECYVKRFKKVDLVADKEHLLLRQFAADSYSPKHKFTGSTELFTSSLEQVVEAYDVLTADTESSLIDNSQVQE